MGKRDLSSYSGPMSNDIAYANRDFIPNADAYIEAWAEDAREYREIEASIGRARLNTPYGDHEREKFDLFHPAGRARGLVVYVHGGYWRMLHRTDWSHFAAGATAAGWAVAMPSYVLAPEARIADITQQIGRAINVIAERIAGPIVLTGHSAGGHLVARMANPDSPLSDKVKARIKRIVPISPVADLQPLIDTAMNDDFRMDEATAVSESPALHPNTLGVGTVTWVGAEERPAFLDQARWLSEAWGAPMRIAPGCHHFDVIEGLKDTESPMMRSLIGGL